jgi:hypothetical protein
VLRTSSAAGYLRRAELIVAVSAADGDDVFQTNRGWRNEATDRETGANMTLKSQTAALATSTLTVPIR